MMALLNLKVYIPGSEHKEDYLTLKIDVLSGHEAWDIISQPMN